MDEALTRNDLLTMREAGKVAARILKGLRKFIAAGITTKDVELYFDRELAAYPGMKPAFKGYHGYPSSVCVSVNDEVIHAIPSKKRKIEDGDLVSVDLGIEYQGLFVDTAYTYMIGKVSKEAKQLVKTTYKALHEGIKQARVGAKVGDISSAVQNFAEGKGCSVIRKFVGHGIGRKLHLPPEIPNFGEAGQGQTLEETMVIAIEPMVSMGNFEVDVLEDGWTARTADRSLSAHFEHTVAITKKGPWILTS
jgi:methionyl aminopeptidase